MNAKKLILKNLRIKNFKGIKELFIPVNLVTTISGDNATGKTTINDAATYLLFGKDSQGRTDFEIQPLNEVGDVIHYLDTEVEAVFDLEGEEFILRKLLNENWQKPRGQAESLLKGTTTSYYIGEVPQKLKEYTTYINSLVDEKLFKILTNPFAFENLAWKEKRALLFEMCGDVTDEEVASSNEKLKNLLQVLDGKSIDDFKKVVAQKKKKLKEDLLKLPARIDELTSSLEEINVASYNDVLKAELASLKNIEEQLEASNKAFEETRKKQQQIISYETKLADLRRKAIEVGMKEINEKKAELNRLEYEEKDINLNVDRYEKSISNMEKEVAENDERISSLTIKVNQLRDDWIKCDAEEFIFDPAKGVCHQCGQELPLDKFNEAKDSARECFEKSKAERIEAITYGANEYKKKIEELTSINDTLKERICNGRAEVSNNLIVMEDIEKSIKSLKFEVSKSQEIEQPVFVETTEMKLITKDINLLQGEIDCCISVDTSELKSKKKAIQSRIDDIRGTLAKADVYEKTRVRIQELEEEHKNIGQMLSELEQQEFLTEEFTRTKVDMLESKINSHFKYVTFKLFNQQVNGGIAECCESLINGVPFSNANNASKINAGLDIINALVNYYNFSAPIFIDNAESVNELIETESQVIRLVVSHDKELVIS